MDRRRLWLDLANAEYIRETLGFPGCQIALRVDRDVIADDGTVRLSDTRYFVTSVDPGSITADELLAAVRNHWQIEGSPSGWLISPPPPPSSCASFAAPPNLSAPTPTTLTGTRAKA